jgi:MFS family permease
MYWEPAKYVAKLRTSRPTPTPLLLHINMEAGHGGASGRYDYLKEIAFDYAFLLLIGTWMTRVATSWLVYRLTGSALLLGTVSFAGQIPTFLFAPFAGVWVDRLDRRQVLSGRRRSPWCSRSRSAALTSRTTSPSTGSWLSA